ncbi:MAG: aspartate--ammonia ligase [Clostridiales bacterium]|nr:aspartate--ammonia ligase [Clostridiales bacterium]
MSRFFLPEGYCQKLSLYKTQEAVSFIKSDFGKRFSTALNLLKVSAPLFVDPASGLNDDLNGIQRPVSFEIAETQSGVQIVQSLAKWKRQVLHDYRFETLTGLYTDMIAVRRDEELTNIHSVYVDQWDWEKIITPRIRNINYLKKTAQAIIKAVCETSEKVNKMFPQITLDLTDKVAFVTTQELEDLYPSLSPRQRENVYLKEHKTAFIMQIGGTLRSGIPHDTRAPDYDDWELNGDIFFYNELLDSAFELCSMGIRVDAAALDRQLNKAGCRDRRTLPFHSALLNNALPPAIGGGIGQSRLCMLLLQKAHIGEVQPSVWDAATVTKCRDAGIALL